MATTTGEDIKDPVSLDEALLKREWQHNPVTKPKHYQTPSGLQAVDVVEQFGLGSHIDQAVIYLLRAGKKDDTTFDQDIRKAIWWLARKIKLPQEEVNDLLKLKAEDNTPKWVPNGG